MMTRALDGTECPISRPPWGTHAVVGRPNLRRQESSGRTPRLGPLEDAEIVRQVKGGRSEAYGELVRKYQDRVFNTCWRICGHLEDARDLTQEAFLKAFENIADFRERSGFYTWIFRVAVNLALSHQRKAARRHTVSLDAERGATGTQAEALVRQVGHASRDDPARTASESELQGCVVRALQALDDDHRAVIVLRDLEGLDYQEIAEVLDIRLGTVKSRLHRARMALHQAIPPALAPDP